MKSFLLAPLLVVMMTAMSSQAIPEILPESKDFKGRALEGYLIDTKSATHQKYLEDPESYTVAEARAALTKKTPFTILVPQHAHNEIFHLRTEAEVQQDGDTEWHYLRAAKSVKKRQRANKVQSVADEPDDFGWLKGKNPREQREAAAKKMGFGADSIEDERSSAIHRPCKEEHNIDYAAVDAFLKTRHRAHDNHGKLKVRVVDTRPSSSSEPAPSAAFRGMRVQSGTIKVEGYLADIYCVDRVNGLDGANMITNPQGHSKHCNLFSVCVPDGYTILTPVPSTATAYGPMYNLTADGNTAAIDWMKPLDEWQRNLLVTQSGKIDSNGKFELVAAADNTFGDKAVAAEPTTTTAAPTESTGSPSTATPTSTTTGTTSAATTAATSSTNTVSAGSTTTATPSSTPVSTTTTQQPSTTSAASSGDGLLLFSPPDDSSSSGAVAKTSFLLLFSTTLLFALLN